jgi:hypothetical protein
MIWYYDVRAFVRHESLSVVDITSTTISRLAFLHQLRNKEREEVPIQLDLLNLLIIGKNNSVFLEVH